MMTNNLDRRARSLQRWSIPVVSLAIGIAYLVAGWMGDDLAFGVAGLVLMSGIAVAMVVLRRHSETVAGLMERDERFASIDTSATAFAGSMMILAVLVGFVVEVARGEDGSPYSLLGAVGGVAYLAALIFQRFRR